jgi:hypothetical protein
MMNMNNYHSSIGDSSVMISQPTVTLQSARRIARGGGLVPSNQ